MTTGPSLGLATTVGVVVPVGPGASGELRAQLAALGRQTWPGPVTVVLSCNGEPVDRVDRVAAAVGWPPTWTVTVVDSSAVRGPGAARNAGWRAVDADLVLFCDADDVVSDTWVAGMVRGLAAAGVCTGPILHDALNEPWMVETAQQAWPVVRFGHLPHTSSANLGVRRAVLETIGGFDVGLAAAEDIDLAWRATHAGFPTHFEAAAAVQYRLRPGLLALFRNQRLYARWDHALVAKHRAAGARWERRAVVRHVVSTALAVVRAPSGRLRRRVAANRLGTLVGWLDGWVEHRLLRR